LGKGIAHEVDAATLPGAGENLANGSLDALSMPTSIAIKRWAVDLGSSPGNHLARHIGAGGLLKQGLKLHHHVGRPGSGPGLNPRFALVYRNPNQTGDRR
jgi:hypothetical protein